MARITLTFRWSPTLIFSLISTFIRLLARLISSALHISSYSWQQRDGLPTVELNEADSVNPSFKSPNVDSNQQLTFQLIVTDNDGSTDSDSVNVLVKDIPSSEVPTPQTGNENEHTPEINLEQNGKSEIPNDGTQTQSEICDNGIDDDGDGKIDSAEEECAPSQPEPTATPQPENNPPTAKDQQVTGEPGKPLAITLQADDSDPGDELTATIVSEPQHGSLGDIDKNSGEITYTAPPGFGGDDSFTFKAIDSHQAESNIATVMII